MILYHGSNQLFKSFDLSHASEGTGVKFGYGIYLTESEASAVHYSQPRNQDQSADHYLYTIEIPDLVENNHPTLLPLITWIRIEYQELNLIISNLSFLHLQQVSLNYYLYSHYSLLFLQLIFQVL